jgi:hypothetical protein
MVFFCHLRFGLLAGGVMKRGFVPHDDGKPYFSNIISQIISISPSRPLALSPSMHQTRFNNEDDFRTVFNLPHASDSSRHCLAGA